MKVGTDGVLLGAWAELEEAASILDIGTGTGLIALMAAQRNAQARIDALEIEPAACREAAYNIRISPWAERIRLYPQALQAFFPAIGYDCILCNPPFFVHSTPAPDNGRSLARHTGTLPHTELIVHAERLLTPHGNSPCRRSLPVNRLCQAIPFIPPENHPCTSQSGKSPQAASYPTDKTSSSSGRNRSDRRTFPPSLQRRIHRFDP